MNIEQQEEKRATLLEKLLHSGDFNLAFRLAPV